MLLRVRRAQTSSTFCVVRAVTLRCQASRILSDEYVPVARASRDKITIYRVSGTMYDTSNIIHSDNGTGTSVGSVGLG